MDAELPGENDPRGSATIVGAARSLGPLIRSHADEAEAARRLPMPVVDALRAAGLMRMCVPAMYGGPEVDPLTMVEAIAAVAEADGAAGWCSMIASTTSSMALFLDPVAAIEVFGDAATISGGAFAPSGTGRTVEGGYEISGRWAWGSGTQHCDWITCGTLTDDGGFRLFFVPAAEVTILDTWYSSGLRGTGSNDFSVDAVVVPAERSVQPLLGRVQVDTALGHFPNFCLLASGVAAATLGIARRAIDELVALADAGKRSVYSSKSLAQTTMAQVEIARAEALLGSARAFLLHELGVAWDQAVAGTRVPVEQRARIRLACTHAARSAAGAVDLAYEAGGGSSVYSSSPLQRCFRDVHTATQHLMVSTRNYETVGKLLFGVDADTSML